jgi:hypothetical protein
MLSHAEQIEITGLVNRLLDNLGSCVSSLTGNDGGELRHQIGDMRAYYFQYLHDGSFSTQMLNCFTLARNINVPLKSIVNIRLGLFQETPVCEVANAIVQQAIIFCLAAESRMITAIEFTSRDDVDTMIGTMKTAFDTSREILADAVDSTQYQTVIYLGGALINYLATTGRPLPRMITFDLAASLPALSLSQLVYYDASRWEELIAENKTVHPAFCQREMRGLSK